MFSTLYDTAICFNLDQSQILASVNGLIFFFLFLRSALLCGPWCSKDGTDLFHTTRTTVLYQRET